MLTRLRKGAGPWGLSRGVVLLCAVCIPSSARGEDGGGSPAPDVREPGGDRRPATQAAGERREARALPDSLFTLRLPGLAWNPAPVQDGAPLASEAAGAVEPQDAPPEAEGETPEGAGEGPAEAPPAETGPHFEEVKSRWDLVPPEYEINEPGNGLDPYRQNKLKGDYPIIGDDIFLNLTFTERLLIEGRRLPTPTGTTSSGGGKTEFFGDGDQFLLQNFASFTVDLFKGQQAFKPVNWRVRATPVYNITYLDVEEVQVVNIDASKGTTRYSDYVALQEALAEIHLFDLTDRYDFISFEGGILPFRSDFRGFIFDDTNLGARIFGNADDNKWQYNLVAFDMLEKDTNSELNTFEDRDQQVVIANVFRQDLFFLGYTGSLSFHYNHDESDTHFNKNGFLVRPAPVGLAKEHEIESYYIGVTGEGHWDRINVTHAFYQVLGRDSNNPFAGREVDINAQMAAAELSYDIDWWRPRLFGLYATGDSDTRDSDAKGFDAILEAPNFAGGGVSFFNRQEIKLLGVNLTQRLSPFVDLSTSKLEGQSNFVNPGLLLFGGALDMEVTPTLRTVVGASYLRFDDTRSLETYLEMEDIDQEAGVEVFAGATYRPLLTNNIVINAGFSPFFSGAGFQKIYQSSEVLFSGFLDVTFTW